jgi:hypothetical protein
MNLNKFSHAINDYNGWQFKSQKKVTSTLVITAIHLLWHMVKIWTSTHTHIGYNILHSWYIVFMVLVMLCEQ